MVASWVLAASTATTTTNNNNQTRAGAVSEGWRHLRAAVGGGRGRWAERRRKGQGAQRAVAPSTTFASRPAACTNLQANNQHSAPLQADWPLVAHHSAGQRTCRLRSAVFLLRIRMAAATALLRSPDTLQGAAAAETRRSGLQRLGAWAAGHLKYLGSELHDGAL